MPRADLYGEELSPEDAPNMIDDVNFLLELETRPLRTSIVNKDLEVLPKLWRRLPAWDQCHYYNVIETLIKRKDDKALAKLSTPSSPFISHFYEPNVLRQILDENPSTPPNMVQKLEALIQSAQPAVNQFTIEEWPQKYALGGQSLEWEKTVWNESAA